MRIVDLTHGHDDDMPVFPGLSRPSFPALATVERDGYAMSEYHFVNHIGRRTSTPPRTRSRAAPRSTRSRSSGSSRTL